MRSPEQWADIIRRGAMSGKVTEAEMLDAVNQIIAHGEARGRLRACKDAMTISEANIQKLRELIATLEAEARGSK